LTAVTPGVAASLTGALRRPGRLVPVLGVLVIWLLVFALFGGQDTLFLDSSDLSTVHRKLNDLNLWVLEHRESSPVFTAFLNVISDLIGSVVTFIQALISQPSFGLPIPAVGWLGVVAGVTYLAWTLGNWRVALLAAAGFAFLGVQGLWQPSMDTLAMTLAAVTISLLVGIPLGVWAGTSDRFNDLITPVLDFMQIMPAFVYLAPLTLLFLIGPASAAIVTIIYAAPPVIRITAHGIRTVPTETVEAAESLGSTRLQALVKVLLPMALRTIILGVNQTIMAALSMVTIAALIGSPGLGQVVYQALTKLDVGTAFNGGLALVVMAIVLDRVTTAAGARWESTVAAYGPARRLRKPLLAAGAVAVLVCGYLSRTYVRAAVFPGDALAGEPGMANLGPVIARAADTTASWVQAHVGGFTDGLRNLVTYAVLNNLERFLTDTPWQATVVALVLLAWLLGQLRAAIVTAGCLAVIVGTGLWHDAMSTLAATLLATVLVLALGVVLGVWMGRSLRADQLIRPTLDAAQVMPAFVYLVPFMALFGASRFTGILAAVVYAAPVSIKIITDGVRAVSPTTVEAATAAGSNSWQIITKVQLPMARSSITLATNQGLIYVLAMVVVSGLVGGGALGYAVVQGFAQISYFGKGLAAGLAIVLLGIMLDRTSQAAARRVGIPPAGLAG
jgi:glycine betaine/proline transport system permease protein